MTKIKIIIFFIGFFVFFGGWQSVKASEQQMRLEKDYYDLGYDSIPNAIHEAESYYKTTIDLPRELPPLDFTHSFGRFNGKNAGIEIEYLNIDKHFNYIINIIPAKEGLKLHSNTDSKIYLKDGTIAYYTIMSRTEGENLIIFIFKKNKWTYVLSIEKDLIDNPLQTLVKMANSF